MPTTLNEASLPVRASYATWLIVLMIWAACTLSTWWFVATFASDIPYGDEYELIAVFTGNQPLTWEWLWSQHNEHRIVLPRLVLYGLHRATGRGSAGMHLNVAMLSAAALICIFAAVRQRGRPAWTDAFFPLLWLHLGQVENLLWSFQVQMVLPSLITAGILYVIASTRGQPRGPKGCLAAFGVLLLTMCGGNGLLVAGPIAFWLTALVICDRWQRSSSGRSYSYAMAVITACSFAVIGLYFVGLHRTTPENASTVDQLRVGLTFLSMSLGRDWQVVWPLSGLCMLCWVVLALGRSIALTRRKTSESLEAWGYAAVVAGSLLHAAAVAHARAASGLDGGLQSRYTTLFCPTMSAVYLGAAVWLAPALHLRGAASLAGVRNFSPIQRTICT